VLPRLLAEFKGPTSKERGMRRGREKEKGSMPGSFSQILALLIMQMQQTAMFV